MEQITSLSNPKVKDAVALQGSSEHRREKGMFIVEGERECMRCIAAGYTPSHFFYSPTINGKDPATLGIERYKVYEVSDAVYQKLAYRGGTEGLVGVFRTGDAKSLDSLHPRENSLIVVLESVEKPGNLGAVLRSADGAGVDAVIICDPKTDLYNPNLIRSSTGAFFSVTCVVSSFEETAKWLRKNNITIFTAQLQDSVVYYDADFTRGTALVFGTESEGLTDKWREISDKKIFIPMLGTSDSLNVSVSMAVLCYEALRQRNFNHSNGTGI